MVRSCRLGPTFSEILSGVSDWNSSMNTLKSIGIEVTEDHARFGRASPTARSTCEVAGPDQVEEIRAPYASLS